MEEEKTGKLEALFGLERVFAKEEVPIALVGERRRERVEERESVELVNVGALLGEEKWRFQVEMLRAECNLMRMEKETAVKKMEGVRVKSLRALRFAAYSLVTERKKISEGNNPKADLEEGIQQLAETLEKLKRSLEAKNHGDRKKCQNLDKQAAKREIQSFRGSSGEVCTENTMCEVNETIVSSEDSNVEILRRKMEGLSNGVLLERMKEECGSMLSTANSSVSSSASTSKRIEVGDSQSSLLQQPFEDACSGRCKAIVRRILEQVRDETEQWSQMQEVVGQVREDMEELQASRDFWEDRAHDYDYQMQTLRSDVQEWRRKAVSSEIKANQLEAQVSFFRMELQRFIGEERADEGTKKRVSISGLKENQNNNNNRHYHQAQASAQSQSRNSQRVGFSGDGRRRKTHTNRATGLVASERWPLKDIRNSFKQQNKANFPSVPYRTSKNVYGEKSVGF